MSAKQSRAGCIFFLLCAYVLSARFLRAPTCASAYLDFFASLYVIAFTDWSDRSCHLHTYHATHLINHSIDGIWLPLYSSHHCEGVLAINFTPPFRLSYWPTAPCLLFLFPLFLGVLFCFMRQSPHSATNTLVSIFGMFVLCPTMRRSSLIHILMFAVSVRFT